MSIDKEGEPSGLVGKMAAGRYLIVSELAADGRRTLYEAENVELGVRVRLGVVRADGTPTGERLREGEKLRSLKQPGLASVLDVGKLDSGDLFVASERADGTSLRALMAGKLLDQRRALAIVRQVLEALAAAHNIDAVHGDIKPESIIVSTLGHADRVTLADFGVAALAGATKTGDARYSAPESALGSIDTRADIYATGAVLFELLTGHPPFFANDDDALRRLHAYAPMQTLKQRAPDQSFVRALEELVAMALARKPEARLQSATDMIAVLDHALNSIEELASPQPEMPSPRRRKANDSLLLLAKDLMPSSSPDASANAVVIPANVERRVPELPWSTRALGRVRNGFDKLRTLAAKLVQSLRALDDRLGIGASTRRLVGKLVDKLGVRARLEHLSSPQRRALAALGAVLVLAVVFAIVASTCGGRTQSKPIAIAERANALVDEGRATEAIELLKRELAAQPDSGAAHVALVKAHLALGHDHDALALYERGVAASPDLATEPELIATLSRIADSHDSATAIAALDLLELHSGVQGHDTIVSHASTCVIADVRHHAFLLAERAGIAARIDRVASWTLDLDQATSCEQRRAAISKLAGAENRRAIAVLRRAKAHKCVERAASAAIQRIIAASKGR